MVTSARLIQGSVFRTLTGLSAPMIGGIFSVVAFNLADTYFVSQLGTQELAAMSFTFPVVMVMFGVAMGLGTGTTSVVSRAIGHGDETMIRRLSSDSLVLSILTVLVFAAVGMLTIDPLFTLLGATPDVLPLIRDYMMIWYLGIVFLVIPMVANAAIRSTGDTAFPALIMVIATGVNIVLDPLLIFGLWGFPRLELEGAAIATVISRALTLVASLLILHFREHLLDFKALTLREMWQSWKAIGKIAIPATVTNLLEPIGLGVVTRLIATYGASSVAAWGAGSRVTAFALVPVFAVCSALVPFVGQNWGAGEYGRVRTGRNYGYIFAVVWSISMIGVLRIFAESVASVFSLDGDVLAEIVRYLWILPFGYFGVGLLRVTEETLNAIGRPIMASVQTLVHMFGLYIPLAFVGANTMAMNGLLGGLAIADAMGGGIGLGMAWWMCRRGRQGEEDGGEAIG
jgi:putative MATE family efflux protein